MEQVLARLRAELADRYTVEHELGRGGMAVVFLAQDRRHRRRVAIKVLRPDVGASGAADRFLREIETVAALHHPHILPLYDSGRAGDHLYYVMPYVEGESLRQRLERVGPLPVDEAVRIGREVADALAFAHQRGVVHRDIKPENILLAAGHATVADFGIARAVDAAGLKLTDTGLAVGTPAYMSPEQATADPRVDGRADQYALACVVYEMLAGHPPFSGATSQAIMARHTTDAVPPLATVRPVPAALERAIRRALAKVPADRWATTEAFAAALNHALPQQTDATPSALQSAPRLLAGGSRIAIAATVIVALVGVAWWQVATTSDGISSGANPRPSVAVLPLTFSGDSNAAVIADGVHELLIQGLTRIDGIQLPGSAKLAKYRGTVPDPQQVGRELKVATVLTGRIHVADRRIRVTPELVRVSDGAVVWTDKFDGVVAIGDTILDLFDIQDEMARKMVAAIFPRFTPQQRSVTATRVPTRDAQAWGLYLEARREAWALTQPALERAISLLHQALARDSSFAEAWAALGQTISYLNGELSATLQATNRAANARNATAAVERAYSLDSNNVLVLIERAWARVDAGDFHSAHADLRRAATLAPSSFDAAMNYGGFIRIVAPDTTLAYVRRAVGIDPTNAVAWNTLAQEHWRRGRLDSALAAAEQAVSLDSTLWYARNIQAKALLAAGRRAEAEQSVAAALRLGAKNVGALQQGTIFFLRAGNRERARRLHEERIAVDRRGMLDDSPTSRVIGHLVAGNRPGAFTALEAGFKAGPFDIAAFLADDGDVLGDNARVEALRAKLFGDFAPFGTAR